MKISKRNDLPTAKEMYYLYVNGSKSMREWAELFNCSITAIRTRIEEYQKELHILQIKKQERIKKRFNTHCRKCVWYDEMANYCPFPFRCVKDEGWKQRRN
ncbi:MAG: hypothetical protein ACOCQD_02555 [archaeon]